MLDRIVSGGQTGADQGALRAARAAGVPTGGWAPKGWLTEGPIDPGTCKPWPKDVAARELLEGFGLVECPERGYPPRTRANVRDSDGTLWFGSHDSRGYATTHDAALAIGKPFAIVYAGATRPSHVAVWVRDNGIRVLNVAGNRESVSPGIGVRVERFMNAVLRRLGGPDPPAPTGVDGAPNAL
jgi:hypothetical protein